MSAPPANPQWGTPPWEIDFRPARDAPPTSVDFAIVGGGFTGLATAAWLRRLNPKASVAVLEESTIGAGASGRTGGLVLAESSAGDLPGLGDVLAGFQEALRLFDIDCDLELRGGFEIGRQNFLPHSPIRWSDSGDLRAVRRVPGGTADAGKLVSGLARAAEKYGAQICENAAVENAAFGEPLQLSLRSGRQMAASRALFATNAYALETAGLDARAKSNITLALLTDPLSPAQIEALGLGARPPFYTVDLPYLWGRLLPGDAAIFGGGIIQCNDWRDLAQVDMREGRAAELLAAIERRVRGLVPEMRAVRFTHRWGGPILVAEGWTPVFEAHPQSPRAIVLGGYSGHGVALAVHLGRWAAEALVGIRPLPHWRKA